MGLEPDLSLFGGFSLCLFIASYPIPSPTNSQFHTALLLSVTTVFSISFFVVSLGLFFVDFVYGGVS